jgi:arylsulfatase A-like enzyme
MNAICLVFDRLQAGFLGAYGNTWIETPSFDRLASQSFLFDQALIDSPRLERLCRSYWQGWHAMCPDARDCPNFRVSENGTVPLSLPALLRAAGVTTALLTDEPLVAQHPLAADFDELIEIDPAWQPQTAQKLDATHFGRCFVEMIEWLESAGEPFMLWCHLGGLGTTWDAPHSFRQSYQDEGDPPPPEGADVPDRTLPANYDPDELLGITQAYSGQVSLLDSCLGAFLDFLDGLPSRDETLLTVTSSRGFPLGEHGRVGPCDEALFSELVHVPWLIRFPDAVHAAVRSQVLVEPADLWATMLDWWNIGDCPNFRASENGTVPLSPTGVSVLPLIRQEPALFRDRLCIVGNHGQRAIRTPAWYLRAGDEPELFAKPDDRWDVNNVSSRCREVVECLQDALTQYALTLPAGRISDLPPLNDVLLNGLDVGIRE